MPIHLHIFLNNLNKILILGIKYKLCFLEILSGRINAANLGFADKLIIWQNMSAGV